MTATLIQEWVKALRADDYAEGTVKRKVQTISAALQQAHREENPETGLPWLLKVPKMPTIKLRNTQDRVVSIDEEAAIFKAIEARQNAEPHRKWWHFKALVMVMLDTGLRLGEALGTGQKSVKRKRWVDPSTGEVREAVYLGLDRYTTKNDKPRDVPVTKRLERLVPMLNEQASGGLWFPWKSRGSGAWYLWDCIRQDLAKEGFDLSEVKNHTFRHTCATRLAENGMDLVSLRDWLGHSNINITAERYIHLTTSHLARGAVILDTLFGSNGAAAPTRTVDDAPCDMRDVQFNGTNRANSGTAHLH